MYDFYPPYNNPQRPLPLPPTAPLDPRLTHYAPSAIYNPWPSPHPFNMNWGPEDQEALLRVGNETRNGQPSSSGSTPTTNPDGCQCQWLVSGIPCRQPFPNFNELMLHMGDAHEVRGRASLRMVCQWCTPTGACGKNNRRDGYRRHIGTHVRTSVPCPNCDKSFSRNDTMRNHIKEKHSNK